MYFIFQVQHEFICYNCELMFMFTCLLINDYSDHLKITVAFMLWKSLRYMSWTWDGLCICGIWNLYMNVV